MSKKRSPIWHYFVPGAEDSRLVPLFFNYVKIKFSKFNEYIYRLLVSASVLDTISVIGISVKSSIGATLIIIIIIIIITTYMHICDCL